MKSKSIKLQKVFKVSIIILGVFLLLGVVTNFSAIKTALSEATTSLSKRNNNSYSDITYEKAKSIYDKTSKFDHIDIRVNGSLTTDGFTREIKLSNVKLKVIDGTKTIIDTSFNDNETYEWRKMGTRISKTAEVYLTFDIILDGEVAREDYVTTFAGKEDFIQAIINCDMNQGLDFQVNATEIIQAALYNVTYQWADLPDGLATVPEQSLGYETDDIYSIDITWKKGSTIVDKENGKLYTFSGWTSWSNNSDLHAQKNTLTNNNLSITEDTIIYGTWTVSTLELKESHITINTALKNNGTSIPKDLYYIITDPTGIEEKILYSSFVNGKYEYPIKTSGEYTIKQYSNSISGYNSSVNVTSDLTNTGQSDNSIIVSTNIPYKLPTDSSSSQSLGTVTYTNSYEKKYGESIYNYPSLLVEAKDSYSQKSIGKTTFVLKAQDNTKKLVTTDETGIIKLANLKEGSYTLTQTETPTNYYVNDTKYSISITSEKPIEKFNEETDKFYLIYNYNIEVSPKQNYDTKNEKLVIYNERITGEMIITSRFSDESDIKETNFPSESEINVLITNKDNYEKKVTLNNANNWTIQLTDLELGTYEVKEIVNDAKIAGYNLDVTYEGGNSTPVSSKVKISLETTKTNVEIINLYEKKYGESVYNYPDFIIETKDKDNQKSVGETTFELKAKNNSREIITTDETGIVKLNNITDGTYTLTQTTTQSNYYVNDTEYTISVELINNKPIEKFNAAEDNFYLVYNYGIKTSPSESYDTNSSKLTVYNERITGEMIITSRFSDESDIKKSDFPSESEINVLVTNKDNYEKTVTLNNANNWTIKLTDLELGTYEVKELVADAKVAGYNLGVTYVGGNVTSSSSKVKISADTTKSYIEIVNIYKKKYGKSVYNYPILTIESKDVDSNEAISNSTYVLTTLDNAKKQIESTPTNISGVYEISNIKEGTYTLTQTKTSSNYYVNETKYTITVDLNNGKPIEQFDETEDNFYLVYNYGIKVTPTENYNSDSKLSIYNKKITGSLTISSKIETVNEVSTNDFIAPKEINLLVTDGHNYSKTISLNSSNNWTNELAGLELGTYEIKELDNNVPGYSLDVKFSGETSSNNSTKVNITAKNNTPIIEMTNTYTLIIKEVENPASITIKQTDADGEIIVDATFGLYDPEEEIIDKQKTDETGTVTFTGITEEGDYSLRLIDAPEKYNIKETEWKINISLNNRKSSVEYDEETNTYKRVYDLDAVINSTDYNDGVLTLSAKGNTLGKKVATYILFIIIILVSLFIIFINTRRDKKDRKKDNKSAEISKENKL